MANAVLPGRELLRRDNVTAKLVPSSEDDIASILVDPQMANAEAHQDVVLSNNAELM